MLRKVRYAVPFVTLRGWFPIPQVAEANPPQPMDVAGEGLLYDESILRVNRLYKADLHLLFFPRHEGSGCRF